MKKYTRKNRQQAALICAIAASFPRHDDRRDMLYYGDIANYLGLDRTIDDAAIELAASAWAHAVVETPGVDLYSCTCDAEAEALIRTGWSP